MPRRWGDSEVADETLPAVLTKHITAHCRALSSEKAVCVIIREQREASPRGSAQYERHSEPRKECLLQQAANEG